MAQPESTTDVVLCPWRREGNEITVAGQATDPAGAVHTLWFRVPASAEGALSTSADPFAIGFLFPCMHWNRPVRIHGVASPVLLANLELLSHVWHQRRPDLYQPIRFLADQEQEAAPAGGDDEAIACFSGGIDSCYTFWRHRQKLIGRRSRNLRAGILGHGFVDLPLDRPAVFQEAYQRCRRMLDSLGAETLPVATNAARDLPMPGRHPWKTAHGTAIGAILHLFAGRFRHGLIASSLTYVTIRNNCGTSPLTDPLLSSAGMDIQDDGSEALRLEKLAAIVDWPEAMAHLRVCNRGLTGGNCGACEKCIRTSVAMRLYRDAPPLCFPAAVTDRQIRTLRVRYPGVLHFWEDILAEAGAKGMRQWPWVRAVGTALRRSRRRLFRKSLTDPVLELFHRARGTW
jgi:hypothetical protein